MIARLFALADGRKAGLGALTASHCTGSTAVSTACRLADDGTLEAQFRCENDNMAKQMRATPGITGDVLLQSTGDVVLTRPRSRTTEFSDRTAAS